MSQEAVDKLMAFECPICWDGDTRLRITSGEFEGASTRRLIEVVPHPEAAS